MTTNVVINSTFTRANKSLDGSVKGKVLDFITKLQQNPDAMGLDLKPPKGARDPRVRTARVNDFWRAVLFELPESAGYVLASVKPHDDAYDYAARLRMEVNAATGALELIDQIAIAQAVNEAATPTPRSSVDEKPLLAGISLSKLKLFGLDEDVAIQALAITDTGKFDVLCDALPVLQGCALLDLAAGREPDDVYRDLLDQEEPEEVETWDILAALKRPSSKLQFASGSNEELLAAIEGDLKAWRVWLHPLQRKLAYHDGWNGPFRVTGGAGTGKTVTALHRARHLAQRDTAAEAPVPSILLATFTRNLADTLSNQLRELTGPTLAKAVDVTNLDSLAYRIISTAGASRPKLVSSDSDEVASAWAIAAAGTPWDPTFLNDEWADVVLAQGLTDQVSYLKAPRAGRGVALNRAKRAEVWTLIEKGQQHLSVSGVITHTQAAGLAADIATITPTLQYRHAIIDEAQDLHPAHWRLVRALVPDAPDDLFIVGDAHQRIYGRPLVLSRYGIRTQGRSRRLTINYRTSEQILRWCVATMSGVTVDDLEGAEDTLMGARSEFSGPEPIALACTGIAGEDDRLVEQVKGWLYEGFSPESIGVLSRAKAGVEAAVKVLTVAGLPTTVVDRFDTQPEAGSVQVMTMHRAKGLEFRCVAITRLGAQHFPPRIVLAGGSDEQKAQRLGQERALLYVAGSRARERLALFYSGSPSSLLKS